MENKQNKPNSGTSSSASSSAANKPAAPQTTPAADSAVTSSTSHVSAATSGHQPSASSGASTRQPQAKSSTSDSPTAQDNTESKTSAQPESTPQKSWLDQEQWAKSIDQLPQSLKDLGNKALEQVNSLSTTQKVVGGALLVSGLGWLALRNKNKSTLDTSLNTSKGETKWNASSESVYRGATSTLHNSDDSFSL